MFIKFLTQIFGSQNDRELKRVAPMVSKINLLEKKFEEKTDSQLKAFVSELKERYQNEESLDSLLFDSFALVRESSKRVLKMRHFDCQLIGGIVLYQGKIAEMKTGEGKTLVATLPVFLHAITQKGAHVITVNDYLAKRDAEWMGQLYNFLGLSVGKIISNMDDEERRQAYRCDITYGTNNEFGFDYLRDNMKFERESLAQENLNFAIVDEVDSILIDEARTPLIISGPAEKSANLYLQANMVIPSLKNEQDYTIDEKSRTALLTEEGVAKVEEKLKIENLYDPLNMDKLHHINQALKAHALFKKDVDYVVTKDKKVVIVDEFTGRLMEGRRYSDGLHQALEAKESVRIENENQTLATITFQNYFRMYDKLSGMTGTALTEAAEFKKIYDLDVIEIPPNKTFIRKDHPDIIYKTKEEKFKAIIKEIKRVNESGQPILVGTISIDDSEDLHNQLKKHKIVHNVLNAKHHQKEAEIIKSAGQKKSVTISTNMAGRGTDIVLGEGVKELGGLYVLGTSRHESRRIDNQLRGRSGRQGDPGASRFFLSLDDDLLRIFGGERLTNIMNKLGMAEGEAIEHKLISRAIENAQRKVEEQNFNVRKQLLEYDDVMNQQREVIYSQRQEALKKDDLKHVIVDMIKDTSFYIVDENLKKDSAISDINLEAIDLLSQKIFNTSFKSVESFKNRDELINFIQDNNLALYEEREKEIGKEELRQLEKYVILEKVDSLWKNHLLNIDHLKEGIGLRGYGQQNPLMVYKKEAYDMFQDMILQVKIDIVSLLFKLKVVNKEEIEHLQQKENANMFLSHGEPQEVKKQPVKASKKPGRNDLCSCGSGKKYKHCCGK